MIIRNDGYLKTEVYNESDVVILIEKGDAIGHGRKKKLAKVVNDKTTPITKPAFDSVSPKMVGSSSCKSFTKENDKEDSFWNDDEGLILNYICDKAVSYTHLTLPTKRIV